MSIREFFVLFWHNFSTKAAWWEQSAVVLLLSLMGMVLLNELLSII